jgi:hypothetical protein
VNTQQLWQAQALDAPRISLAFVRQQAESWRSWARMRNATNYIACLVLTPFILLQAWLVFSVTPLVSLALVLNVPLCAWLLVRWHRRAAAQEQPAELGVLDALKFHRRQLERQRDVRLDRWRRWPAIPGVLLLILAEAIEIKPTPWVGFGVAIVLMTLVLSIAIVVEERIARRIQKEIDALDSL